MNTVTKWATYSTCVSTRNTCSTRVCVRAQRAENDSCKLQRDRTGRIYNYICTHHHQVIVITHTSLTFSSCAMAQYWPLSFVAQEKSTTWSTSRVTSRFSCINGDQCIVKQVGMHPLSNKYRHASIVKQVGMHPLSNK